MASDQVFVGLMSGTSLDGVDAVLADFALASPLLASHYLPFDTPLRDELRALQAPGPNELERAAEAAVVLADVYAAAVAAVLDAARLPPAAVRAIGCHGQTVRHRPARGYTLQLMNGARLAELSAIAVICDFRSRDVAAGGHGAPLVPAFHAATMRHPAIDRVIVNIGGIANITWLPHGNADTAAKAPAHTVTGFDCGPGNVLMDEWIGVHVPGRRHDEGGAWAASGVVLPALLERLLAHPYLAEPPPKSTGREVFNLEWLRSRLNGTPAAGNVQATLLEVTARTIADAVQRYCPGATEAYVCGGGVHNGALMHRLAALLPDGLVASTGALGLDPDWVEATAFAWLAREMIAGRPGNLPAVTGAAGPRVLGCLYPA